MFLIQSLLIALQLLLIETFPLFRVKVQSNVENVHFKKLMWTEEQTVGTADPQIQG